MENGVNRASVIETEITVSAWPKHDEDAKVNNLYEENQKGCTKSLNNLPNISSSSLLPPTNCREQTRWPSVGLKSFLQIK